MHMNFQIGVDLQEISDRSRCKLHMLLLLLNPAQTQIHKYTNKKIQIQKHKYTNGIVYNVRELPNKC